MEDELLNLDNPTDENVKELLASYHKKVKTNFPSKRNCTLVCFLLFETFLYANIFYNVRLFSMEKLSSLLSEKCKFEISFFGYIFPIKIFCDTKIQ